MPTKPNRAGNQQNYVPAGNGDASGEYGDNATGSNIHINIKEKDDTKEVKSTKPVETKPNINHSEKISNYIQSHSRMSKASMQTINNEINTGSSEAQELLSKALDKHNYSFKIGKSSYYQPGGEGSMVLANSSMSSEYRNPGETFWHENGHLIDFSNTEFQFGTSKSSQTLSATFRSEKDNRTLFDVVNEEGQKFASNKEALAEIQAEKNKIQQKYFDEIGYNEEEKNRLIKERDEIDQEIRNDPRYLEVIEYKDNLRKEFYKTGSMEIAKEIQNSLSKIANTYENISNEKKGYNELKLKIDKIHEDYFDAKQKASREFTKKYSSLSDMLDGATGGYTNLNCGAHGRRYWKSDSYSKAHEFFAETFSAYARQDKEELDIIRKYYPRSVEIFEEIIRKYR